MKSAFLLIAQAYEPAQPIELVCTLNDSTSTVVANESTGQISHNDVFVAEPRVGRNTIAYSFTTKGGSSRFAVVINRVDGRMTVTVTPRTAKPSGNPIRMIGFCKRITERAF